MRRLPLLCAALLVAASASSALADPVEIRDDGTYVRTEPVKAEVTPGRACAGLFSLPWLCLSRE